MIKYSVEVLVALPNHTWILVEQEFEMEDSGDNAARMYAMERTATECDNRNIVVVGMLVYSFVILEETP